MCEVGRCFDDVGSVRIGGELKESNAFVHSDGEVRDRSGWMGIKVAYAVGAINRAVFIG